MPGWVMVTPYQTGAASMVVGLWVMTMNCERCAELAQQVGEAFDVRAVERGVHFVQHAEGAGLDVEEGEQQGGGGQGAFAAGQQGQVLALLAGRLDEDVDAGFQNVVGVGQDEFGLAAAEQAGEDGLEGRADGVERFQKDAARAVVDLLDGGQQFGAGLFQVGGLGQSGTRGASATSSYSSMAAGLTSPSARSSRRRRATSCGVPSATSGSSSSARAASSAISYSSQSRAARAVALRAQPGFAHLVLVDGFQRLRPRLAQRAQLRAGVVRTPAAAPAAPRPALPERPAAASRAARARTTSASRASVCATSASQFRLRRLRLPRLALLLAGQRCRVSACAAPQRRGPGCRLFGRPSPARCAPRSVPPAGRRAPPSATAAARLRRPGPRRRPPSRRCRSPARPRRRGLLPRLGERVAGAARHAGALAARGFVGPACLGRGPLRPALGFGLGRLRGLPRRLRLGQARHPRASRASSAAVSSCLAPFRLALLARRVRPGPTRSRSCGPGCSPCGPPDARRSAPRSAGPISPVRVTTRFQPWATVEARRASSSVSQTKTRPSSTSRAGRNLGSNVTMSRAAPSTPVRPMRPAQVQRVAARTHPVQRQERRPPGAVARADRRWRLWPRLPCR